MAETVQGNIDLDALAAYYAQQYPTIDPSAAMGTQAGIGGAAPIPTPMTGGDPWAGADASTLGWGQQQTPIKWGEMLKLAQAGISPLTPKPYVFAPGSASVQGGPQGKTNMAPPGTPVRPQGPSLSELLGMIRGR